MKLEKITFEVEPFRAVVRKYANTIWFDKEVHKEQLKIDIAEEMGIPSEYIKICKVELETPNEDEV